jgi:hypothetical protein
LPQKKLLNATVKTEGFCGVQNFRLGVFTEPKKGSPKLEKMTILAGSVERSGSFVPTIIVNGDGRYFASPAGRPSHVSYATAHAVPDPR